MKEEDEKIKVRSHCLEERAFGDKCRRGGEWGSVVIKKIMERTLEVKNIAHSSSILAYFYF